MSDNKLKAVQDHFDRIAPLRQRWKNRNKYYYQKLTEYFRFFIPEDQRVLEVGSGDGSLLDALKPSRGLGIDASPRFVEQAAARYPHLEFRHGFAETCQADETFDVIILSDLVGYLNDVQAALQNLKQFTKPSTRVIIHYYNYLWEPVLRLGNKLGLRMDQGVQNWLSLEDLENLLHISGYEVIKKTRKVLFPFYIPLVSAFLNRIVANLPVIRKLCLMDFIVARPEPEPRAQYPSVSIVIPARNEAGNIDELVRRIPSFPARSEIIFIEGNSKDNTRQAIEDAIARYPEKEIVLTEVPSQKGKGPAVRLGFQRAKYDVFIILDSDISVAPEDLTKFYELLVSGKGEFINGTRLVYQMERKAMRFLNILGNKFFSLAFTYLLDQKIKDTLCGTKAIYRSDYEKIAKNRSYFGDFDPFGDFDLLFGSAKLNLKFIECPVRYYERRYGRTNIHRFRHGALLLGMCGIAMKRLKFV